MSHKLVSEVDYLSACHNYLGWCTQCEDFTRECTEPDARKYNCPICEEMTVYGAEEALMMGLFEVEDVPGG